ncbi:ATP-binding protein [Streptomyces sp. NBC_01515]|uniref:ATP-binding protein n=1 Tax=Streptomyces sp. NBC_01515 TaxID=2903890 RepID=UPI003865ED52
MDAVNAIDAVERSYVSFASAPESGLCSVRGEVRGQLARWGRSELAEDAVLVVSELLGNAFGHGAGPVRLSLALHERAGHQWLMIQVSDTSPGFDTEVIRARWTRPSAALSGGGRGLLLVEALSRAWGDRHHRRGHTVWADLPRSVSAGSPRGLLRQGRASG